MGYKLLLLRPFYFTLLSCQFAQMSFAEKKRSCKYVKTNELRMLTPYDGAKVRSPNKEK